jgi:cytochrome c553
MRTLVFTSIALGILALTTRTWGQEAREFDESPAWHGRATGRIVPEPQFYVAAEPRKPQPRNDLPTEDGERTFQEYCTSCHDAERAFRKRKTLAGWQSTVQRMAKMPDAEIPEAVREPIAQYLAGRAGQPEAKGAESGGTTAQPAAPAAKEPGGRTAEQETEKAKGKEQAPKFDPALVQQGTTAFNNYCTTCHGAEKSLQATKSLAAWRSTVRRMAEKDGANIPENTHEAIAVYLASLGAGKQGKGGSTEETVSPLTITGAISPSYRYSGEQNLEDPGHFGDAWLGFAWQGKGPVSARVTTCISCHSQGLQLGNIELVEASVRFDVSKALCPDPKNAPLLKLSVEAGRFVVPFGAYYQEVNPGVDRAVSRPLIYNMGQRVDPFSIGDPVLPMPYCDEGASLNLSAPLGCNWNTTFNAYAVNGLEGNNAGIDFYESRDYVDNNRWPAVGGRATIGGEHLRLGCSVMGGRFNPDTGAGPQQDGLGYLIFGADAAYHWKDVFRMQFEFAQRNTDHFGTLPNNSQAALFTEHVSGYYLEAELLVWRKKHVSLFARYDSQFRDYPLPAASLAAAGGFGVNRFTYGVNWTLPGGSLLMINHEYWDLPQPLGATNVVGVRWAATF